MTAPSQKTTKKKKRWIYAPCMKEERCKTKIQKLAKNKFARSLIRGTLYRVKIRGGCSCGDTADCINRRTERLRKKQNMAFGKKIIRKLDTSMYEIAALVHAKDFNGIDNQVQKFITDVKKKLTKYEKHARAAILTGEDTDITREQVRETVSWARHGLALVRCIHNKSA